MYFFSSYSLKAQEINRHITGSSTESILTYENLFWCFFSAFPKLWKMESSLWSSISNLHQQICDQFLQDYFSTENNYIYTQIFYFRAPSTLKKGTDGEYEQHPTPPTPPKWALISYLWYRYRNNIWEHCRIWNRSLWMYRSKGAGCSLGTELVPGKWHVCEGQLQLSPCDTAQGLLFPKSRVLLSWSLHRHSRDP